MKYCLIKEKLESVEALDFKVPYVAILNKEEWLNQKEQFSFGIDLDLNVDEALTTEVKVNYDSLTGTFSIPDRTCIEQSKGFSFALDKKGIVLIDESGKSMQYIEKIQKTKKWRRGSLERFLYDFLELIIEDDLIILEQMEKQLQIVEDEILVQPTTDFIKRVNEIRKDLLDLSTHYEQLIDFGQELEENENYFFREENLRLFRMFTDRVIRLQTIVQSQREYTVQIRDLYQTQIDVRQNHIMSILTLVTSIFMPLTLIAGWYGMNFKYMPELESIYAYPIVIVVSIVIAVSGLIFYKKKKWL